MKPSSSNKKSDWNWFCVDSASTGMIHNCSSACALIIYCTSHTKAITSAMPPSSLLCLRPWGCKLNFTPQQQDTWVHLAAQSASWWLAGTPVWEREPEQPVLTCLAILAAHHKQSLPHSLTATSTFSHAGRGDTSLTHSIDTWKGRQNISPLERYTEDNTSWQGLWS